MPVYQALELRFWDDARETGLIAVAQPLLFYAYSGFSVVEGFLDFLNAGAYAGLDSHSCYYDSTHIPLLKDQLCQYSPPLMLITSPVI